MRDENRCSISLGSILWIKLEILSISGVFEVFHAENFVSYC